MIRVWREKDSWLLFIVGEICTRVVVFSSPELHACTGIKESHAHTTRTLHNI